MRSLQHALLVSVLFTLCASGAADAAGRQSRSQSTPLSRSETEVLVKADLAKRLKVAVEQLTVVAAAERTWPDATLGCVARKGLVEPAPVPGFAFTLAHAGKQYVYHTDRRGHFKRCDDAKRLGAVSR